MRGQWNMREWETEFWRSFFERKIKDLKAGYIKEVDLTQEDLCPENVIDTLRAIGYDDEDCDENGWEQDTWITFRSKEDEVGVVLFYCGRTFEMKFFLAEKED